ncbi:hypothetical protein Fmac_017467 [Flemingia macrophylla]|uniref:Glycosyltransferase N-terminal domain-containing protein n=1 Tax=Flemingia macrophylla TaxID=520843 RepID=A0ABD1M2C9_9FABA
MQKMGTQHVMVLPFPAQGHVNPLMSFSKRLTQHGFRVTFVNTDFIHKRVVSATNEEVNLEGSAVRLVSVPDGLGPMDDRIDTASMCSAILRAMPSAIERLIKDMNGGSEKISAMVADLNMAWALEIAHELGLKGVVFCPSSAAIFALQDNIPKLIQDGILDNHGIPIIEEKFQLSPTMPFLETTNIPWCTIGDTTVQKTIYDYLARYMNVTHLTNWWICSTTSELEYGALSLCPKILPIGPILMESGDDKLRSLGQFWEEDLSCLNWLDQQPPCSIIYIAFGSTTFFYPNQLKELALGLGLTKKPFLWVVRDDASDNTKITYLDEFEGNRGKIVKWAPQQKVLSHPAIACFFSLCGWNSIMEGVTNGVPFLCWPYFADQLFNKAYICDVWKVGLGFDLDDRGLIPHWEIKKKVDQLLGDENMRGRSQKLKEMIVRNIAEGGESYENFKKFEEWLRK